MKALIKQLTETCAPSGHESAVREIIQTAVAPYADSVEVDALGNLHVLKKGTGGGLTVMLAAHIASHPVPGFWRV